MKPQSDTDLRRVGGDVVLFGLRSIDHQVHIGVNSHPIRISSLEQFEVLEHSQTMGTCVSRSFLAS